MTARPAREAPSEFIMRGGWGSGAGRHCVVFPEPARGKRGNGVPTPFPCGGRPWRVAGQAAGCRATTSAKETDGPPSGKRPQGALPRWSRAGRSLAPAPSCAVRMEDGAGPTPGSVRSEVASPPRKNGAGRKHRAARKASLRRRFSVGLAPQQEDTRAVVAVLPRPRQHRALQRENTAGRGGEEIFDHLLVLLGLEAAG